MTDLELILVAVTALSLLGTVFAMVESNQQKRSARSQGVHAQALTDRLVRAHQILEELQSSSNSKDTIIDSLLEQRDEAQTKAKELTQLLNNNQEYILALEDKAIAKKAAKKLVQQTFDQKVSDNNKIAASKFKKAPAKKAATKKFKKG